MDILTGVFRQMYKSGIGAFYNTLTIDYWTFLIARADGVAQGEVAFPWGAEYDKPQPVRTLPGVPTQESRRALLAVSRTSWNLCRLEAFKKQLTGNDGTTISGACFTPEAMTSPR